MADFNFVCRYLPCIAGAPANRAGPPQKGRKYPEEAYYMLGFVSGMLGMLIHNNTDVSMRFVSSGTPFWLLVGVNVALMSYSPMPKNNRGPGAKGQPLVIDTPAGNPLLLWIVKLVTYAAIAIVAIVF